MIRNEVSRRRRFVLVAIYQLSASLNFNALLRDDQLYKASHVTHPVVSEATFKVIDTLHGHL